MLDVTVVRANDLPIGDIKTSDPYIKLMSIDHEGKYFRFGRTETIDSTLDPVFQKKYYSTPIVHTSKVFFQVMDYDVGSSDDILGTAIIDVATLVNSPCMEITIPIEKDKAFENDGKSPTLTIKSDLIVDLPVATFKKENSSYLWFMMYSDYPDYDAQLSFMICNSLKGRSIYTTDKIPNYLAISKQKDYFYKYGPCQIARFNLNMIKDGTYFIAPMIETADRYSEARFNIQIISGPEYELKTRNGITYYCSGSDSNKSLFSVGEFSCILNRPGSFFFAGGIQIKTGNMKTINYEQFERSKYKANEVYSLKFKNMGV